MRKFMVTDVKTNLESAIVAAKSAKESAKTNEDVTDKSLFGGERGISGDVELEMMCSRCKRVLVLRTIRRAFFELEQRTENIEFNIHKN